ncbi:hypothetical protein D0859_17105 [Hortaea werneckii]|uniref:Phospholipid-transporting ATPase n=1 Tax=Hortaea werneckii TaxID=91943 RepID=A0A3M7I0E5_HORWE|nr:hypothetical protein D0859_17105 [Hortaea werneckii]
MAAPYRNQYRHSLAHPDAYSDDEDDLELDNLDPVTALTPDPNRRSHDWGRRLPPRILQRFAAARRRPREEDEERLVGDGGERAGADATEEGAHKRERSDADAPLLADDEAGAERDSLNAAGRPPRRKGLLSRLLALGRSRGGAISLPESSRADGGGDDGDDDDLSSSTRTLSVGRLAPSSSPPPTKYPANAISNAKYSPASFLPRTLWNEFKFFFNLYFLLVALSQVIPALRIGYLSTYVAPLAFVLCVTLGKEAYDDIQRRRRDGEANGEIYRVLRFEEHRAEDPEWAGRNGGASKKKTGKGKKGKRRQASQEDDEHDRLSNVEREEQNTEDVETPTASFVEVNKPSKNLKVGDVVVLGKDQRVPADVVILKSFSTETEKLPAYDPAPTPSKSTTPAAGEGSLLETESQPDPPDSELQAEAANALPLSDKTTTPDPSAGGEAFIRTDQLDGETDWKLRLATPLAQTLPPSEYPRLRLTAGKPDRRVNDFVGNVELLTRPHWSGEHTEGIEHSLPLTIDNTAWANTVLASSTTVHAVVVYTGPQTRAALGTSASRSKTGLLELEINSLTKALCFLTAALSAALVVGHHIYTADFTNAHPGNARPWYLNALRFLILFSTIVPISLRVNLDMGKSVYAYFIHRDQGIPGTVVRTSTIPEELGRIEYLLSDKTGTLTRNEMEMKKCHVGTVGYGGEAMEEVRGFVQAAFDGFGGHAQEGRLWTPSVGLDDSTQTASGTRTRREIATRVRDMVLALGVCHSVTPTMEEDPDTGEVSTSYQASSPDEIAIVQWTAAVGLQVSHRDRRSITLTSTFTGQVVVRVEILNIFPFTSESKRMGIIARFCKYADRTKTSEGDDEIVFFQKGADTVMSSIVVANDWLDEETGNMAREGLRTLVVGRKNLTQETYEAFKQAYQEASLSMTGRDAAMARVVKSHLEQDLDLLGITGVEDKLQPNVKASLELLRNAGIKIWMLTGDKVETARCVAISSKLVSRGQTIHTIAGLKRKEFALDALGPLQSRHGRTSALLIDGQSLALYLSHHKEDFISTAVRLPAVIACRCSPTQKADLALLIRAWTRKRVACIGDGGNDVSMIQAADVGLGIVGKEGRQASLAADFSLTQFAHITKLLVWHGRNSYKRSAKLALFVMHRGLIAAVAQAVFSVSFGGEPIALYRDWLLVGYATLYTMAPVFSLVLDRDVDEPLAILYPELYRELTHSPSSSRPLSWRAFFLWTAISLYQGIVLQLGSALLTPGSSWAAAPTTGNNPVDPSSRAGVQHMIALSYSALLATELLMVACEVTTWHWIMLVSLLVTAGAYVASIPFLGDYFDLRFFTQVGFWWRFAILVAVAVGPVWVGKAVGRRVRPSGWRKVRGV